MGNIYDNKTGDGVIGSVYMNETDVGFAALFQWFRESQFVGYSKPIARVGVTCLVLRPKRSSGWFVAISPFNYVSWIGISIAIIAYIISLIFIMRFSSGSNDSRENRNLVWHVLKIHLWQSIKIMCVSS